MDKEKEDHLHVLVPHSEKELFIAAAHRACKNLSTWVRDTLKKAALKEKRA
jgi:hypothetical protein